MIDHVVAVDRRIDERVALQRFGGGLDEEAHEAELDAVGLLERLAERLAHLRHFARLTSLNEVSMAIEFFDCIRRSAMRARMRVIGTRSSGRDPGWAARPGLAGRSGAAVPPLL